MTPIKVGEYTVIQGNNPWGRYEILAPDGQPMWAPLRQKPNGWLIHSRCFRSLAMALYLAAKAAGIERQRVEVRAPWLRTEDTSTPEEPYLFVPTCDFWDEREEQVNLGELAHEYARERYAELGGAA